MKLNRVLLLSAASLIVSVLPIWSNALSEASTATNADVTLAQNPPVAIASGTFVAAEKPTNGTVRVVEDGGHRYLEFSAAFSTSDQGPDLHVLLDPAAEPSASYENLGSVINLGALSSFTGAQRYPIPDSINVEDYQSVVIWCRMANATFGYAPL
jgi:Electron transfer DM13